MSLTPISFRDTKVLSDTRPQRVINSFWVFFPNVNLPDSNYLNATKDVWVLLRYIRGEAYNYSINGRLHFTFDFGAVNNTDIGDQVVLTNYPFYRDSQQDGRYTLVVPVGAFIS